MDNMLSPESILSRAAACGRVGRSLSYVGYFAPLTDDVIAAFECGEARRKSDLDHIRAQRAETWARLRNRLSASLYGESK
jgi:hypothetical protein